MLAVKRESPAVVIGEILNPIQFACKPIYTSSGSGSLFPHLL